MTKEKGGMTKEKGGMTKEKGGFGGGNLALPKQTKEKGKSPGHAASPQLKGKSSPQMSRAG